MLNNSAAFASLQSLTITAVFRVIDMRLFSRLIILPLSALTLISLPFSANTASSGPSGIEITTPQDIQWVRNKEGTSERAILFGDPDKPGPYVIRIKWLANNFSHPHFHNTDRFFAVIKGTWWVGSGNKYNPSSTVPAPAGSYVLHPAGAVHYDGAKDEETIIQVWGIGPVKTTPAEVK